MVDSVNPADVANAFLFSLSTRKLEYRSALGSYYYAKAIPDHELLKSHNEKLAAIGNHCYLCDWQAWDRTPSDWERRNGLNVLNFERHKWGGVRHTKLDYALFDLEQFLLLPNVTPTEEDIENGIRTADVIDRSIERIGMYQNLDTVKIDTNGRNISEIAEAITAL